MTEDQRSLPPEPNRQATVSANPHRIHRRWALVAPFIACTVYGVAVPFGAGSPAWLSFAVIFSAFLLAMLVTATWLMAGRGRPFVRLADLPTWLDTAALLWTAFALTATVILLMI